MEIGLITPPVGTVLNVVCGVARITMDDAFKGVMPFFLAQLAVLFLLVLFPDLVLVPLKWWLAQPYAVWAKALANRLQRS